MIAAWSDRDSSDSKGEEEAENICIMVNKKTKPNDAEKTMRPNLLINIKARIQLGPLNHLLGWHPNIWLSKVFVLVGKP